MSNLVGDMILRRIAMEMRPSCKVIGRLQLKGYNEKFELFNNLLRCCSRNHYYRMQDFDVDQIYNLDNDSDVLRGWFLFALTHKIEGLKGILLNRLDKDSAFPAL